MKKKTRKFFTDEWYKQKRVQKVRETRDAIALLSISYTPPISPLPLYELCVIKNGELFL